MSDFHSALAELRSILLDPNTPVEVVNSGSRIIQREDELLLIVPEPSGTPGTDEFILTFQASDFFLKYLSALRAFDWKIALILEHQISPSLVA